MWTIIGKFLLKILGIKMEGSFPTDLKKYVVIAGPHTSNLDFPYGMIGQAAYGLNFKANFLGKHTLFKPPFGFIFRALGGIPVDRSKSNNLVEQVVSEAAKHEKFILVLAPEGTRSKVDKLKSGFYHIAKGLNVPIVIAGFDIGNKRFIIEKPYYVTDYMTDMNYFHSYFAKLQGVNPELGLPPSYDYGQSNTDLGKKTETPTPTPNFH